MPRFKRMFAECVVLLGLLVCAEPLGAVVNQSGSVTPGHAACWTATGVIKDCGSATTPVLTSIGTLGSGPTICANSGPATGAFNRICLSATATDGGINMTNIGGATGGFTFTLNGVAQGMGTVTLPVTTLNGACFADSTGTLQDCGYVPLTNTLASGSIFYGVGGVATSTTPTVFLNSAFSSTAGSILYRGPSVWAATPSQIYYVKAYGAVCDNATDDATAIQAAITAAGAAGGGIVFFPAATCLSASTLTIAASYVKLAGVGRGSSIIRSTSTGSAIVVNTGLTGVEITDLQVKRTDTAAAGRDCIHFNNLTERALIERVDVVACYNGLRLGITSYSIVRDVLANNNQLHGVYITNADGAGGLQWQIFDTLSQQNDGNGYLVEAVTSDAAVGIFVGAKTYANKLNGIRFVGSATPFRLQGPRIIGAFVGNDCAAGIYLDTYAAANAQIADSYVEATGTGACGVNLGTAATNVGNGIFLTANNTEVSITGAHIVSNSYTGIKSSAARVLISGSNVRLNGLAAAAGETSGIHAVTGNATITGNSSKGQAFGVALTNDNHVVIGNDLSENTTAPLLAVASLIASVVCGNIPTSTVVACPITTSGIGNTATTVSQYDDIVFTNAAFTLPRIWTLPAASSVKQGRRIRVVDWQGTVTSTNTLTVLRAGADTVNGGTSIVLANAFDGVTLESDGTSKWTFASLGIEQGGTGATTAAGARTALGLGTAATQNTGTSGTNVPLLDGTNTSSGINTFSNTTNATSTSTGAIVTSGGIGVAKTIIAGTGVGIGAMLTTGASFSITSSLGAQAGNAYSMYMLPTLTPATASQAYFGFFAGTVATGASNTIGYGVGLYVDTLAKTGTGTVTNAYGLYVQSQTIGGTINYSGYFGGKVTIGAETTNANGLGIAQTTDSSGLTTGSFITLGGAAIAKALFVGTTLNVLTMAADTAQTDVTVCRVAASGLLLTGTGALGICLGTSGSQFKTAFAPMSAGIDEIMKIDFQNYRYREGYGDGGNRIQYGPTAQDVEAALPDLARHDSKGETINYDSGALFFIGLRAIQQLKVDNDNLREEMRELKRAIGR